VNNQGVLSNFPEQIDFEYYTDDSMHLLKRHIFTETEALELGLDYGDDKSMLGVNGYPCTKGLVLKMNGSSAD
jgi:hypothetical protein